MRAALGRGLSFLAGWLIVLPLALCLSLAYWLGAFDGFDEED